MPKALLDFLGYKFFFWSNENAEPPHIHVCKGQQTSSATTSFFIFTLLGSVQDTGHKASAMHPAPCYSPLHVPPYTH